jgi:predicted house-cleaning noncanonical NTP pyrophosphatase (MazG superfamily)
MNLLKSANHLNTTGNYAENMAVKLADEIKEITNDDL